MFIQFFCTMLWTLLDLNQRPTDYAYHFGFHRPFRVCGLDYAFTMSYDEGG